VVPILRMCKAFATSPLELGHGSGDNIKFMRSQLKRSHVFRLGNATLGCMADSGRNANIRAGATEVVI
jgi:hypothetical protein